MSDVAAIALKLAGHVAVAAAGVVAFLTFFDWLLSEEQKKALTDYLIKVWNWLDDNRDLNWLRRFQTSAIHFKIFGILTLVYIAICYIVTTAVFKSDGSLLFIPSAFGAIAASITLARFSFVIEWMTKPKSVVLYLLRNLLVFSLFNVLPLLLLIVLGLPLIVFGVTQTANISDTPAVAANIAALIQLALFCLVFFAGCFSTMQLWFWAITLGYVLVMVILLVAGTMLRIILARMAEYSKGPILGLAGLVGAVGAVASWLAGK